MNRVVLALVVWAVVASAGFAVVLKAEREARATSVEMGKRYEAAQRRLTAMQGQVQAAVSNAATARLELKQVLDAIPEERDAPVPTAVRDSLCQRLRCK